MKTRRTFLTRNDVVERLRRHLKTNNLTHQQWASANNLSAGLVSAVLRKVAPPGPKILRALGIDTTPHFALIHTQDDTTKPAQHLEDWPDNEQTTESEHVR